MKDKLKEAINTYNKIAEIYAKYSDEKLMQYQLVKFEDLLKGKKILDAGCGTGRDAAYLTEDGFEVVGIDLSKKMLELAKKRTKAKFKVMDLRDLKFKKEEFDGIWCMSTLSDIPQNEAKTIIQNFMKILKTNGIIYISAREGKGHKIIRKEKYGTDRSYYYYKQEELNKIIKGLDLEIVSSEVNTSRGVNWIEIFAKKLT